MPNLGPLEIIVILLLALVFFGAKRLPELGKGLGQGIREFRKAGKDIRAELDDSFKDEAKPVSTTDKA